MSGLVDSLGLAAMELRVAECVMRTGRLGRRRRFRVDLHGVSVFGPGAEHTLIRWERIESIAVEGPGLATVTSATAVVAFPKGAFGLSPDALVEQLQDARSIERRGEVIGDLAS